MACVLSTIAAVLNENTSHFALKELYRTRFEKTFIQCNDHIKNISLRKNQLKV